VGLKKGENLGLIPPALKEEGVEEREPEGVRESEAAFWGIVFVAVWVGWRELERSREVFPVESWREAFWEEEREEEDPGVEENELENEFEP